MKRSDDINTLASGCIWRFSKKNTDMHVALRGNLSRSGSAADLVEASKDAASLLVCTLTKFFWLGVQIFLSDVISGGLLGHLDPPYLALGANC